MSNDPDVRPPVSAVNHKTILIAEDHDMVRQVLFDTLRQAGYHLLVARNGVEALRVSRQHSGPIHLLIADVIMPHLGGHDLAVQLKLRFPALKVLFISGYACLDAEPNATITPGLPFLDKPFDLYVLGQKVRELLADGAEATS